MGRAFVDLDTIDPEHEAVSISKVRAYLPQRHEFELVDHVCHLDCEDGTILAYKDFGGEDWWTRGHFPDRPILPGILLCEGAAQVATVLWKEIAQLGNITIGFGGLESVRFRGQVVPPARVFFAAKKGKIGSRMAKFPTQAFADGKLVFEASILGVAI